MASTVVQSGDYLLELGTGWNWTAFKLGDYATKVTRTNLVSNPSLETNTTNWSGTSATITRITTDAYVGSACLRVEVSGLATSHGGRFGGSPKIPVTVGLPYIISFFVKVPSGQPSCSLRIRTREFTAAGVNQQSQVSGATTVTDADGWVRLSFSDTPIVNTVDMDIQVEKSNAPGSARVWLVDAAMMEQSSAGIASFHCSQYFDFIASLMSFGISILTPSETET